MRYCPHFLHWVRFHVVRPPFQISGSRVLRYRVRSVLLHFGQFVNSPFTLGRSAGNGADSAAIACGGASFTFNVLGVDFLRGFRFAIFAILYNLETLERFFGVFSVSAFFLRILWPSPAAPAIDAPTAAPTIQSNQWLSGRCGFHFHSSTLRPLLSTSNLYSPHSWSAKHAWFWGLSLNKARRPGCPAAVPSAS